MLKPAVCATAIALVSLAPLAAAADTTCDRGAFRRDWTMSIVSNANPETIVCSLSFINNYGRFQGTCHILSDTGPTTPPAEVYSSLSGRLILDADCHFTGSATVVDPLATWTVPLEGYAWSGVTGLPQMATGFGSLNMSGYTAHMSFTMIRRLWNSGVAIINPPPL